MLKEVGLGSTGLSNFWMVNANLGYGPKELGTVDGKSLIHLQCHIGTDTQSWARREAYKQQQEGSRYGRSVSMPLGFVSGDTGVAWLQSNKVFKPIYLKSSQLYLQSICVSEYPDNSLVLRPAPRLIPQRCQGGTSEINLAYSQ